MEARIDAPTSWPEAQNQTTAHACCCGAKRCGMLGWITAPALAYVHEVHVIVAWLAGCTVVLGGTIYLHTASSYVPFNVDYWPTHETFFVTTTGDGTTVCR